MKLTYIFLFFPIFVFGLTLPKLKVETYHLSNGLKVILYEDHTAPIVTVNVNYQVGSKNETTGKTGYAHLFEHIMFQGSKNFNDDYFKALQDIGGEVNGATNQDRTRYYENVPSSFLERALWLEADRMGFLLPALTEERLKNQIDVVKNERRQNYDDAPYGLALEEILKLLYPPEHPYSWPTIGFHKDLSSANLEDMVEFFEKYYVPSNSSICIGGDFDKEETKKLIEKYFGTIPAGKPISYIKKWVPEFTSVKKKVLKDKVQLPRVYILWHTIPIYDEFDAEMDIFAKVLGEGISSPLYQKIVKEKGLGSEVSVYHSSSLISGYFEIIITLKDQKDIDKVEQEVLKTIKEVLQKPIDNDLFLAAQKMYLKDFVDSMKRIGGFGGICDRLNAYNHYLSEPDKFQWDLERYLNATPESVQNAAKKFLEKPYGMLVVEPMGDLKSSKEEVDRTKIPEGKKEISYFFKDLHNFKLSNGINVFYYNYDKIPESLILFSFSAGSSFEEKNLYGISNALSIMLTRGTQEKSAEEIEKELKKIGGELDTFSDLDNLNLKLSILQENFDEGLKILKEIIEKPSLKAEEWENLKKELFAKIKRQKDSLPSTAQFGILRNLFKEHPYNHHYLGMEETLKKIKIEDIKKFYNEFINPKLLSLIYIGPLKVNEFKEKIKIFENWEKKIEQFKIIESARLLNSLEFYLVDKPKSAQSYITFSFIGPSPAHKDYPAFMIGNHILGGYFLSRLNLKLREEKGFTYGARSNLIPLKFGSYWTLRTPVDIRFTKEALEDIFNELKAILKDKPITLEEFEKAKNNLILQLPARFESPDNLLSFISIIAEYNLPLNYLNEYPKKLKEVKLNEVQNIMEKYFKPKNFLVLIVSDKEKVLDSLKELNFEKINIFNPFEYNLKD